MSVYDYQMRTAPTGMGTAIHPADLTPAQSRLLEGVMPSRYGVQKLAPRWKPLIADPNADGSLITGMAVWLTDATTPFTPNALLVFTNTAILQYDVPNYSYDQIRSGQRSRISVPKVFADISSLFPGAASVLGGLVATLQYKRELVISISNFEDPNLTKMYRYYRDISNATIVHPLGMDAPPAPGLVAGVGGALTSGNTYSYKITQVDEFARESSPSLPTSILLGAAQTAVTVTGGPFDAQAVTWNIYRNNGPNPAGGGLIYNLVASLPVATTSFFDTLADTAITNNPIAPNPGENDRPHPADIMSIHSDRLLLNYLGNPSFLQVSNADSITQFAATTDGTHPSDGILTAVGGEGEHEITGIVNLGTPSAIMKRSSIFLLYGTDSTNFELRQTHQSPGVGCTNHRGVVRTPNEVFFPSREGPRTLGYENGFISDPIAVEIDNLFHGWSEVVQHGEPAPIGNIPPVTVPIPALAPLGAGFLTINTTYTYQVTEVDYLSRESGPSGDGFQVLAGAFQTAVGITFGVARLGTRYWNVYRSVATAPFGPWFVAQVPVGNTTVGGYNYIDMIADATIQANAIPVPAGPAYLPPDTEPQATEVLERSQLNMNAFYLDNRYYLSMNDRTLVYDLLAKGWADTGWGFLPTVALLQDGGQNLTGSAPAAIFATQGSIVNPGNLVSYFTTADRWNDPDTFTGVSDNMLQRLGYYGREITGDFDGEGVPQARRKRARRFTLWGKTEQRRGTKLGTLYLWSSDRLIGKWPIRAGQTIRNPDALFEQEFPNSAVGTELYVELRWTDPSVVCGNRRLEYVLLDVKRIEKLYRDTSPS